MRITRDQLISTAKDTVKRETFGTNDLVCAYITGSLTREEPLIGGTTDIDLIYVHSLETIQRREIVPITDEFHLDISHFPQSYFRQPRELRADAWVGSFLCDYPILLHDTNHWFDFVRSGAFAHFFSPANAILRVRPFIESARAGWLKLSTGQIPAHREAVRVYLQTLKDAANAVACVHSVPLTDRRLVLDFPAAAQALNMPGLAGGLVDLIVPPDPIEPDWDEWLRHWGIAFSSIQGAAGQPLSFTDSRRPYYERAIRALSADNSPSALWLLLRSWSRMGAFLPEHNSSQSGYDAVLSQVALGQDDFSTRLSALDLFLDTTEEAIDAWQASSGI